MNEARKGSAQRSSWVAVTAGVLGGVLLLGTVGTAAVAGVAAANYDGTEKRQRLTESADGIVQIDVEASAAKFRIDCETAPAPGGDSRGQHRPRRPPLLPGSAPGLQAPHLCSEPRSWLRWSRPVLTAKRFQARPSRDDGT